MSAETVAFEDILVDALAADATIQAEIGNPARIRTNTAPPFEPLPVLHIQYLPGGDVARALDGKAGIVDAQFEIAGVGAGNDMMALKPLFDRVDAMVDGQTFSNAAIVARVAKHSPIERPEVVFGTTRYSHLGAVYKVRISPIF